LSEPIINSARKRLNLSANVFRDTVETAAQQGSVRDYWRIVQKHRRIASTFFLVVVFSTLFYTLIQPKIYVASTTILIEQGQSNVLSFRDIFSVRTSGSDYYQTQYELLKSRSVGKRVMTELNLWPKYSGARDPVGAFLKTIVVKPIKSSRLADLRASSTSPEEAARIANGFVQYYVGLNLDNKTEMSKQAADWLDAKVEQVRLKLDKLETDFEVVRLQKELAELDERYLPRHPEVVRRKERLEKLTLQLGDQIEVLTSGNLLVRYNQLERETTSTRSVYEQLLTRLKETIASEGVEDTNVFVVDPAEPPSKHSSPRLIRSLFFAMLIGGLGALGLCLVFEALDNTIKSAEDVEQLIELPVLGVLPSWNAKKDELIVEKDRMSGVSEAFRAIRTSLLYSSPDKPLKTLLVTSPNPEEGKSIVAANLALTIAQSGARTLFIDADLRKPRVEEMFGVVGTMGLSEAIATPRNPGEFIQSTKYENFFILSSGQIPPMPSELLGSQKMRQLLEQFRSQFDFVILDTPPFMMVTDAVVLGTLVDGAMAVVRYGQTPKTIASHIKRKFLDVRAPILGVVLNGLDVKRERYQDSTYSYTYSRYSKTRNPKKAPQTPTKKKTQDASATRETSQATGRLPS
jgi:capsular exopolysaccharide synthesis family protein